MRISLGVRRGKPTSFGRLALSSLPLRTSERSQEALDLPSYECTLVKLESSCHR